MSSNDVFSQNDEPGNDTMSHDGSSLSHNGEPSWRNAASFLVVFDDTTGKMLSLQKQGDDGLDEFDDAREFNTTGALTTFSTGPFGHWKRPGSTEIKIESLQDRILLGWTRQSILGKVFATTWLDGPDCGLVVDDAEMSDESHALKPCMGTGNNITLYWTRID
jgi:hypothetical protein